MRKTNIMTLAMASCVFLASCSSSYQAAGGVTGAMIGSDIGGAIGWLSGGHGYHHHHGHYRGDNAALGSLIGMGIGAVLGVGIASAIEEKEKAEAESARRQYDAYNYPNTSNETTTYSNGNSGNGGYYGNQDYQIGGGSYNGATAGNDSYNYGNSTYSDAVPTSAITISDLTYTDANGDGYANKGETLEVESYITNVSNSVLHDVTISIAIDDEKDYNTSPSLTTNLQPGQKIRYTGRIYCKKARSGESVGISVKTACNGKTASSSTLFVATR